MTAAIENIGGGDPGVCEVFWYGPTEHISCVINKADSQVWIAAEMLYELLYRSEKIHPALTLTGPDGGKPQHCDHLDDGRCGIHHCTLCYAGNLLRIEGDNRTVVYRIESYIPEQNAWLAVWPD